MNTIDVGGIKLKGQAVLAPLSGITDAPFRRLAHRFGAGMVVSEMIASHDLVNGRPDTMRKAIGKGDVSPFVIQLAGREPEWMDLGARMAEDLGADIIDINMGCPAKKVTGGLSGSALMREPERAMSLVRAVKKAVSVPVTVKMRLGWDEESRNAPQLAQAMEAEGVAMISVHGRTRQQFYKGRADWEFISLVKKEISIPLLANGDVESFEDAKDILQTSGADGVMIGRGAQGRPWFPGAVSRYLDDGQRQANLDIPELADLMAEHYDAMLDHYGPENGMRAARKHLGWYVEHSGLAAQDAKTWRSRFCQEEDPHVVMSAISEFAKADPAPTKARGPMAGQKTERAVA